MMKRREFISRIAGAAVAAPFALGALAACGDDGGGDDGGGDPADAAVGGPDAAPRPDARRPDAMPAAVDCEANGTSITISNPHGHTMTVTKEEVTAGVEITYQIRGNGSHPHTVTITAADFTMLQANTMVTKTSSNDNGHTHSVTVRCSPA